MPTDGLRGGIRIPVFVFIISCALVGYQSALLVRQRGWANALPPIDITPSFVNDDDAAAIPPPWSMPWFSGKNSGTEEFIGNDDLDDEKEEEEEDDGANVHDEGRIRVEHAAPGWEADTRWETNEEAESDDMLSGASLAAMRVPLVPLVKTQAPPSSGAAEVSTEPARWDASEPSVDNSSDNESNFYSTTGQAFDAMASKSVALQRYRDASEPSGKRRGIAFLKTHKCGSSTLGSIVFRYASRHGQRMPRVHHNIAAGYELKGNISKCDVALQHIQASKWKYAFEWYTLAIQRPVFITILREPVSHYTSWAHFYKLPETSTARPPPPPTGAIAAIAAADLDGAAAVRAFSSKDTSEAPRPLTLDEFVFSSLARRSPMAQ